MAQITITRLDATWSEVSINPSHNGVKNILINRNQGLDKIKTMDLPESLDMIKLFFNDGEVLELHFSLGVKVDETNATDNNHLKELLKTHLTS